MATRVRALDEARRRWDRAVLEIGDQLRTSRHILGTTQRQVATAIGVSSTEVSRRELGRSPRMPAALLAEHAAAVGLKLSVKLYPVGGGLRDEAQVRYLTAFVARIGQLWRVILEAPIPLAGDLRAVDALLISGAVRIAVEVITRVADLQAQLRAAQLKARDIQATRLIIVVSGTHANRRVIASARHALVGTFELDSRRLLAELAAGRDPRVDGIVVLSLDGRNGHSVAAVPAPGDGPPGTRPLPG